MNASCSKCKKRTPHRRTQSGSWYRFWCEVCGNELKDTTEAWLDALRQPHPNQSQIDAESAAMLREG